ncbi:Tctex-1 [Tribonema minus]|uniref:Tctex-1 n=1 Tax=Tribonema minus TaxID=303371 RepID=A0A836CM67_9STRA|nr:Tctex-1 [Tribonema minus]|eukprot:TRINITY_DN27172_c0_g1_i1.p2 TRINITY_DN27172_c0_g1~~TRINITY_DN27172_c0_g1_i1.p2  ORF type:complete len:121 (-),score=35.69 TRINITY_DN27172_c0_g1_i1:2-364(-)
MDIEASEQTAFLPEQVEGILMAAIDAVLKNEVYVEAKAQHWVDSICDKCMAGLHSLNKPFKYIVTAAVIQKNGAGVHAGHSAFWDIGSDNLCQVSWPTDKMREQQGSRIKCIVTAFGLSL